VKIYLETYQSAHTDKSRYKIWIIYSRTTFSTLFHLSCNNILDILNSGDARSNLWGYIKAKAQPKRCFQGSRDYSFVTTATIWSSNKITNSLRIMGFYTKFLRSHSTRINTWRDIWY